MRDEAFYGGNIDVPLSEVGEAEAKAAAAYIAKTHGGDVCAIFSSPMARARYGAQAIAASLARATIAPQLSVHAYEAFREFDRGLWSNMTRAEVTLIRRHTPFSPYVAPRFPHMSEINFF